MKLGPAFRVSRRAALQITTLDICLAAAVACIAVPGFAGLAAGLLGLVIDPDPGGWGATGMEILGILFFSGFFAWMTAIVAVPLALVCAGVGLIGWAAALLGGAFAAQSLTIVASLADVGEMRPDASPGSVLFLAVVGALYGGAGWTFLRWRRPGAFCAGRADFGG